MLQQVFEQLYYAMQIINNDSLTTSTLYFYLRLALTMYLKDPRFSFIDKR